MNKRVKNVVFIAVATVLTSFLLGSSNAHAVMLPDGESGGGGTTAYTEYSPVYKILLSDIEKCYTDGAFKKEVNISSISERTNGNSAISAILEKPKQKVVIPNGLIGNLSDSIKEITCEELLNGKNTFFNGDAAGIIKNPNAIPTKASSPTEIEEFLKFFGYEADKDKVNPNERCFNYKYHYTSSWTGGFLGLGLPADVSEDRYTDFICVKVDENTGKIISNATVKPYSASVDIVQFELKDNDSRIQLDCNTRFFGDGGCHSFRLSDYDYEGLKNAILADLAGNNRVKSYTEQSGCPHDNPAFCFQRIHDISYRLIDSEDSPITETTISDYKISANPSKNLIKALSGSTKAPKITEDDVAALYITYLLKYYNAKQVCGLSDEQKIIYTATGENGYGAILYRPNADNKECYVYPTTHKADKANGMNLVNQSLGYAIAEDSTDFKGIVEWLKKYKGSVDTNLDTAVALDAENKVDGENSTQSDVCLEKNAADSMSWIVCPAVNGMAKGSDGLYGAIKDLLEVKSSVIAQDTDTYKIWGSFRDIANVLFIVVILAIILSQVTGFGIDNYGIKKMLPRLIICAILVNLSYIICQVAVDLSNVTGTSLDFMLSSLAKSSVEEAGKFSILSAIEAILGGGGAIASAGLPFVITAFSIGATGWWLVLVIVVIALLIILVAGLVAFLMLGARQLIVVVGVVISPLAFICYALPNTEKLFKKWLDIFKAALFVFPICSALNGIGQIIQAIVFGSGGKDGLNFATVLIAAACPFLPFLALPSLLKGSMKAVGDIGNKISGLRSKAANAAHRANEAVQRTDAFKDAKQQAELKRNESRANRLMDKIRKRENSGQNVSDRMRRRAGVLNQRVAQGNALNSKNMTWGSQERVEAAERSLAHQEAESAIQDWATTISLDPNFNAEDGAKMYSLSKEARIAANAARAAGRTIDADSLDAKADAYVDLAGKTGKSAATYLNALYSEDKDFVLDQRTARRIFSGEGSKAFKSIDPMAYQYAREIYNGDAAQHTDENGNTVNESSIGAWRSNAQNVQRAMDKNGNTQEAFNSMSGAVLERLTNNNSELLKSLAALDQKGGTHYVQNIEQMAAEAREHHPDASKNTAWDTIRNGRESVSTTVQREQTNVIQGLTNAVGGMADAQNRQASEIASAVASALKENPPTLKIDHSNVPNSHIEVAGSDSSMEAIRNRIIDPNNNNGNNRRN